VRNPSLWRTVGIAVVLSGLAAGATTILVPDTTLGVTPKVILFSYALTAIIFGSMWTAWRHADATAYSALMRGHDILVRWRVAFLSTSDLAGDNAPGIPQVFHYDSGLPEVERLRVA
jgi:hypothetical protein